MADLGRLLISKIIDECDLTTAMAAGVRPQWFEEDEHRVVYKWMCEYFSRYREPPTEQALKTQFPNYRLIAAHEPYEFYTDLFRDHRERTILVDSVIDANTALQDDDPKKARDRLSRGLASLGREVSSLTDEDAVKKLKARYDAYEEARKTAGQLTGIPTGFVGIDYVTSGWHEEQFVVFGGGPKQGKSFMLMKSAIAAHERGYRVLFLSFEMSCSEQLVRYDAMTCGINSGRLLHKTLTDDDMVLLKEGMRARRNMEPFIISADIAAATTVSGLSGKIEQHQPDVVFVDGAYLMENEDGHEARSPQAYTAISRGLKRLAQRVKLPVIVTTQSLLSKMKGGEVSMGSLGWTSAWAQDADLIMGVEKLAEDEAPMIKFRVVGGRNVSPREVRIKCDWEESLFEELEEEEVDARSERGGRPRTTRDRD